VAKKPVVALQLYTVRNEDPVILVSRRAGAARVVFSG
jgi:hypothetical protein